MSQAPETLRALVAEYLSDQCTVIIEAGEPLRDGQNLVHGTRVAVRRLRSTLRTFDDLFDVPQAAAAEEELLWWASVLGAVRDLDVLAHRLSAAIATLPAELVLGPVESHIRGELQTSRKTAYEALLTALDAARYRELVATLERWRAQPPLTEAAEVPAAKATSYVKRAGKKLDRRLADALAADAAGEPGAGEAFHSARKAGKRHRYAAELAAPVLGSKAEKIIANRKALQDVLGDFQDSLVSAAFLRDVGARYGARSGHNGFTYGVLFAQEHQIGTTMAERVKPFLR